MLPAPAQLVRSLFDDPTELLRREFGRYLTNPATDGDWIGKYPADVREDDDAFHVEAELPGFVRDEIDVSLEDGTLTITAQRKSEEKQGETHLHERRYTKVARSFRLPTPVDDTKVEAKLDHGVLHLTLPKRDEVKPRRIKVS